jgi:hypothetical protein
MVLLELMSGALKYRTMLKVLKVIGVVCQASQGMAVTLGGVFVRSPGCAEFLTGFAYLLVEGRGHSLGLETCLDCRYISSETYVRNGSSHRLPK